MILSATTADSNDSIPAKNAIVKADGNKIIICCNENIGNIGIGKLFESKPNLDPMVGTLIFKTVTAIVANATTIKKTGNLGHFFLIIKIVTTVVIAIIVAHIFKVFKF